jgi:hypothetical protein
MKTLKIALVAAIVACTMVSLAYADGTPDKPKLKKIVILSYDKALQNPGLVAAMYRQIEKEDILNCPGHVYVAQVVYIWNIYRISGTLDQWNRFLKRAGVKPVNKSKGDNLL